MIINGVMYNDDMSEADYIKNEELCNLNYNIHTSTHISTTWTKYDGTVININEMSNEHIINCLNMLERNGCKNDPHINVFLTELSRRNIIIKATSKTIIVYEMV